MSKCPVPQCNATLRKGNTSGVCRIHRHFEGLCQCVQCAGKVEAARPRAKFNRPTSKVTLRHEPTPDNPDGRTFVVTMPAQPAWISDQGAGGQA